MPRRKNAYVDSSVFGGVHDEEFSEPSELFFEQAAAGKFLVNLFLGYKQVDIRSPLELIYGDENENV